MKKALAAMVVAALLAISASSALAGGGGWAVRVKGGGRAEVTWGTWRGTSTVHVALPWRHGVRVGAFDVVTVAGARESGGTGKIVCAVLHGGVVVARQVGAWTLRGLPDLCDDELEDGHGSAGRTHLTSDGLPSSTE